MLHYGIAGLGPDQPSKRTPKIVRIDFDRFIPTVLFMSEATTLDDHRRMGCSTSICQESEEYKQDAWERLRRKKGRAKLPVGSCSMSHQVVRICQNDKEREIEQCSVVSGFHLQFSIRN